jgi:hypothetical protein
MKAELKTPLSTQNPNPASELIFHEERALRHLRRETHRTLRALTLLGARALRLLALLFDTAFARVELVREVGPGHRPLTRDQWQPKRESRMLY